MISTKYGSFSPAQISDAKISIRKSIFFLLLYVDPNTKHEYPSINVNEAFDNLQRRLDGLNSILLNPPEIVNVMCLIEAAWKEYENPGFSYSKYRKLILDAGSEIMKLKEGD